MTANRKLLTGGALAVLAVLFVAVVLISNLLLRGARIDLTRGQIHTLSQGTRNIIAKIDEPIQLYFFFSDKATQSHPQVRNYAQRVRELLETMVGRSSGKLKLEVIDPLPFSDDEDRATSLGLQPVPLGPNRENVFLGVAGTNTTDGKVTLPFLLPDKESLLEYEVAKLIHELSQTKKPAVGLISKLPLQGEFNPMTRGMNDPWIVEQQLRQFFNVRELETGQIKTIDPDLNVLVLVHPKGLSDDVLYAIDQFVMRGGHLLVFVDPVANSDPSGGGDPNNPQVAMMADKSSDLPKLFKAWGVHYDPGRVVLDRGHALRITTARGALVRDPSILGMTKRDLDSSDVITANLESINMQTAGFFQLAKDSPHKLVPLILTGSEAMVVPVMRVKYLPDPSTLMVNYQAANERYVLAGRLEGKFTTAFPERKDQGHLAEAKGNGILVLVADTDLLMDRMWVQTQQFMGQKVMNPFANNGDFFINAVDNLTGSSDLISIRGRATSQTPFMKVNDMRRAAEESFRDKEMVLQNQLKDTERKLASLQRGRANVNEQVLSPEQQQELTSFSQKKVEIRKELRRIRRGLDEQIEALGTRLKLINIGLMPFLLTLGALAFAWYRRRQRSAGGTA